MQKKKQKDDQCHQYNRSKPRNGPNFLLTCPMDERLGGLVDQGRS